MPIRRTAPPRFRTQSKDSAAAPRRLVLSAAPPADSICTYRPIRYYAAHRPAAIVSAAQFFVNWTGPVLSARFSAECSVACAYQNMCSGVSRDAVASALRLVLESRTLAGSEQLRSLLTYLV